MRYFPILFSLILILTACGPKPEPAPTPEPKKDVTAELKKAIDEFGDLPSTGTAARVDKAFAYYNIELADLKIDLDSTSPDQLAPLQAEIERMEKVKKEEYTRYLKLRAENGMAVVQDQAKQVGDQIKDAANQAGDAIEGAAKKTGDSLKEAGQKIEEAVTN